MKLTGLLALLFVNSISAFCFGEVSFKIVETTGDVRFRAPFSADWSKVSEDSRVPAGSIVNIAGESAVSYDVLKDGQSLTAGCS